MPVNIFGTYMCILYNYLTSTSISTHHCYNRLELCGSIKSVLQFSCVLLLLRFCCLVVCFIYFRHFFCLFIYLFICLFMFKISQFPLFRGEERLQREHFFA